MTRRLAVLAAVAAFTGAAGGTARGALVAQLGGGSNAVFLARLMPLFRASSAGGSFEIPFFRLSRHLHQTATLQKVVRANKRRRDLGARNRGNHAENSSKTQARKSAPVELSVCLRSYRANTLSTGTASRIARRRAAERAHAFAARSSAQQANRTPAAMKKSLADYRDATRSPIFMVSGCRTAAWRLTTSSAAGPAATTPCHEMP